jgi:hypothetical protein
VNPLRARVLSITLLVFVLGLAPEVSDPRLVVRAFADDLNARDAEAALRLFGDSATVQVDRDPQSREQVRGWIEQLMRDDVRVELIGEPRLGVRNGPHGGTTVTWSARLSSRAQSGEDAGVSAVIANDKLIFLRMRASPADELGGDDRLAR